MQPRTQLPTSTPTPVLSPCAAPIRRGLEDIRIRSIRPTDLDRERRFVHGLSARSRYLRLLSGRPLLPGELERWTRIDAEREIAFIAVVGDDDGEEEEIGVARCVLEDAAERRWDFAIVVADAWQRHGLGELLLCRLLQAATVARVRTLGGITLSENRGMLALARKLGFHARRESGDATVTRVELRLHA